MRWWVGFSLSRLSCRSFLGVSGSSGLIMTVKKNPHVIIIISGPPWILILIFNLFFSSRFPAVTDRDRRDRNHGVRNGTEDVAVSESGVKDHRLHPTANQRNPLVSPVRISFYTLVGGDYISLWNWFWLLAGSSGRQCRKQRVHGFGFRRPMELDRVWRKGRTAARTCRLRQPTSRSR